MSPLKQDNRLLQVKTTLGKDVFILRSLRGREEMSHLFNYTLDLVSEKTAIAAKDIVGKNITFSTVQANDKLRHFNGFVRSFSAGGQDHLPEEDTSIRHYRAEVVPGFWFLSLNRNSRIFQEKKVPEIIEQVCKDAGLTDYQLKLTGKFAKLDFCVQYGESDFDFVSRLMQQNGIAYYFNHTDAKNTLVIGDNPNAYVDCVENKIDFNDLGSEYGRIERFEHQHNFGSGVVVYDHYDFEKVTAKLESKETTSVKLTGVDKHEVYNYPGNFVKTADGKHFAKTHMEMIEARHDIASGSSRCMTFTPGGKFKINESPIEEEKNQAYVLVAVEHEARQSLGTRESGDADGYNNTFSCVPAKIVFRPEHHTPKPRIRGPQTAKVVGATGKEIDIDKYGRVKVQFHWDREGKFDDKSSCWIRVAQRWAGQNWGSVFHPRVGDEVLVEFLEGDPDRPIVTGSVYNADNMPPFKLPESASLAGIKTYTIDKGKAKNFNELHFDDTKEKEKIYFHAERDFERVVENNDSLKVGFDTKDKGDQTIEIFNQRSVIIHEADDKLQLKTGNRDITVDKGDQTIKLSKGTATLDAATAIVLKVGTNSIKIDTKGIVIKGAKVTILADTKAHVKGGVDLVLEAGVKAALKGTTVDVAGSAMTSVKGAMVKIN